MKTYKHVKLGWKAVKNSDGYIVTNPLEPANPNCLYLNLPAELIEGSPDWIEVKEPEFVITSFRGKSKLVAEFMYIQKNGGYSYLQYDPTGGIPLHRVLHEDYCVDNGDFEIYSVRYKDSEFKIGDKTNCGIIEEFVIGEEWLDGMGVFFETKGGLTLSGVTHSPKVILTTEDGYTIDDPEQMLYYVDNELTIGRVRAASISGKFKYFLSSDFAEKFISENKPKFSEKMIRKCFDIPFLTQDDLITKLNKLT